MGGLEVNLGRWGSGEVSLGCVSSFLNEGSSIVFSSASLSTFSQGGVFMCCLL